MANYYHGRGLMEIRQSSNPFFKTVNSDIGSSVNSNVNESFQWKHDPNPALLIPSNEKDGSFPFLFARTSDLIGSHVQVPSDPTSSNKKNIYSKTEFLKKRREDLLLTIDEMNLKALSESYNIKKNKVVKVDTADKLKCYKHEPIKEHPLYTRSSSEIGRKPPTIATFVSERATFSQDFTRSFNNIKPQYSTLNTSLSRSNVHSALDPQFM